MKTQLFNPFDYMQTQKVFIDALSHLVKKHGVADIAETIGVNRESLYKSFNGKVSPRWDTVRKVMRVLNVDITHAA